MFDEARALLFFSDMFNLNIQMYGRFELDQFVSTLAQAGTTRLAKILMHHACKLKQTHTYEIIVIVIVFKKIYKTHLHFAQFWWYTQSNKLY